MSDIDLERVWSIVQGAPMRMVRDFASDFLDGDDLATETEWRVFAFDVLQSGIGDPDSGCPQTLEGIRALFEVKS